MGVRARSGRVERMVAAVGGEGEGEGCEGDGELGVGAWT